VIRLGAGTSPSATNPNPPYQAAHFALLVGNEAPDGVQVGWTTSNYVNPTKGGAIEGVRIYRAGKTLSVLNTGPDVACRDAATMTIVNGAGGFAYPGDRASGGTTRDPASYANNGSEQGFEVAGQNSATANVGGPL
jgi:hypothetical protein